MIGAFIASNAVGLTNAGESSLFDHIREDGLFHDTGESVLFHEISIGTVVLGVDGDIVRMILQSIYGLKEDTFTIKIIGAVFVVNKVTVLYGRTHKIVI